MGLAYGETAAREVSRRIQNAANIATPTALGTAYPSTALDEGMVAVLSDGATFQFSFIPTAAADGKLIAQPADNPSAGRWLRIDKFVDLKIAVDFNATDAQVLYTVPVGFRLQPKRPFWEVTTPFTGGASSAIGVSSSNAAYNTKGDLLGGASGDVAAGLTAGFRGTVGAKVASLGLVVLVAGDTLRFDRIVSAFTAGAGFLHFACELVAL